MVSLSNEYDHLKYKQLTYCMFHFINKLAVQRHYKMVKNFAKTYNVPNFPDSLSVFFVKSYLSNSPA